MGIEVKELEKNISTDRDAMDFIEILVLAIGHDPMAIAKITETIANNAYTAIQRIPYRQMMRYINGMKKVEDELGEACKLSEKLFSNPNKRDENAMRVYKMVTSAETVRKIDYLVDASRSMLIGLIDNEMMFRIFRAIIESLPEDLDYLAGLIEKEGPFKGNIRIHALARTGLMITAGIDSNSDVEEQEYHISSLGYAVDQFALSLNNEDRCFWYRQKTDSNRVRKFIGPSDASDEEVRAIVDAAFEDQKQEIIDAATPKWGEIPSVDDHLSKISILSENKEAVALLIYATKTQGRVIIMQDISHSNPYVEIGENMLPDNDDARESALWTGAVKTLESMNLLECVNYAQKIYRLTADGWNDANTYIEENDLTERDLISPQMILKALEE